MKFQQLSIALLLALSSSAVFALSLGQVKMRSSLGQPLIADIPLYDADDEDMQSLNVSLGPDQAFRRLGLDPKHYKDIQIQILTNENGQYYIQLQSKKPFNEPVFNVLLEANWQNGGHLIREFTALVDPPYIANTAAQTIDSPTVVLSPVVSEAELSFAPQVRTPSIPTGSTPAAKLAVKPISKPITAKPAAIPKTVKPTSVPAVAESAKIVPALQTVSIPATQTNQVVVEKGDNLSNIATRQQQQIGQTSVSLNQMMNAIQRANPEAFINGNKNLLKSGSIIRLPNEQQVIALLPEDAANLLQKQWANKIMAQPTPVLNSANKLNNKSPTAQSQAPSKTAANKVNNQGRLKIVPTAGAMNNAGSQSGASKSGQGQELRAENSLSQEEGAARQAEISTLKNQLTEAENLQVESKRLIELQSSQIKLLTKRMQDLEKSSTTQVSTSQPSKQTQTADSNKISNTNAWYYSPFVILAGLLLLAGLLGMLLKQKRK